MKTYRFIIFIACMLCLSYLTGCQNEKPKIIKMPISPELQLSVDRAMGIHRPSELDAPVTVDYDSYNNEYKVSRDFKVVDEKDSSMFVRIKGIAFKEWGKTLRYVEASEFRKVDGDVFKVVIYFEQGDSLWFVNWVHNQSGDYLYVAGNNINPKTLFHNGKYRDKQCVIEEDKLNKEMEGLNPPAPLAHVTEEFDLSFSNRPGKTEKCALQRLSHDEITDVKVISYDDVVCKGKVRKEDRKYFIQLMGCLNNM